jgi:predicted AAA+ superfamily ATPase
MASKQLAFWPDGEKIPDDDVRRVYQRPPEMPELFSKSALIVGAKGVGKTTLLRYQKAIHEGVAL